MAKTIQEMTKAELLAEVARLREVKKVNAARGVTQLPNGDLWRGHDEDRAERSDTLKATPAKRQPTRADAERFAAGQAIVAHEGTAGE